jgi:hypothetical protein
MSLSPIISEKKLEDLSTLELIRTTFLRKVEEALLIFFIFKLNYCYRKLKNIK